MYIIYPSQELGVTAIYFSPLFESETHGYDTVDYYKVDIYIYIYIYYKVESNGLLPSPSVHPGPPSSTPAEQHTGVRADAPFPHFISRAILLVKNDIVMTCIQEILFPYFTLHKFY